MYCTEKTKEPKVTYTVIEDVKAEVISISEAKEFMALDFPDFDGFLVPLFISAAREAAEKYTGLSIGKRQIQLAGDWENDEAYMPFEPIINTEVNGLQDVGYDSTTVPSALKLGMLNMIHNAFENRAGGINFDSSLKIIAAYRRRVGL